MHDPYPGKELLTVKEVMRLVSMDRTSFGEWLKEMEKKGVAFPKPVRLPGEKERRRYRKWEVMAFIELLPPEG